MTALIKKFFDQKLAEFMNVDQENMTFDLVGGKIMLRQAQFKAEVFDGLHFPIALKGGYIDEMSFTFNTSFLSSGPAQVVIKNVFFVLGPHKSDWTWEDIDACKTKLVDLIMKVYELKSPKKKKADAIQGGWMADAKRKVIDDMKEKVMGMLQVQVSNVHFRYEDAETQGKPFASGFKIGYVNVTSKEKSSRGKEHRSTGDWKGSKQRLADPFFCQTINARRISAYWDTNKDRDSLFAMKPVSGEIVRQKFGSLNRREMFSACVVEKILEMFPPDHKRRKYLDGPNFRERLDFHQYLVFPAALRADVTVNKPNEVAKRQKVPLKDADVEFEPLELALDSEQVQSMNELLAFTKNFTKRDNLFRTRPREPISKYLRSPQSSGGHARTNAPSGRSSSSSQSADSDEQKLKELVKQWWHHAWRGVLLMCNVPKSRLDREELKRKMRVRENYVKLSIEYMDAVEQEKKAIAAGGASASDAPASGTAAAAAALLREKQMELSLKDIIDWRQLARAQRADKLNIKEDDEEESPEEKERKLEEQKRNAMAKMPNTLQVRLHFKAFQAFFLVVADQLWKDAMAAKLPSSQRSPQLKRSQGLKAPMTRMLVVKGSVQNVRVEAVQKGRDNHQIARWVEVGVGNISATNCSVKKPGDSVRQMLNITQFLPEKQISDQRGEAVCIYIGLTMLEAKEAGLQDDDVPISALLEPWGGTANHLRQFPAKIGPEKLEKLGFLGDTFNNPDEKLVGKQLTCVFARVGQVRALCYNPFVRRLLHFLKRGQGSQMTDLVRRPSPLAIDRELLVKLQRKVELMTGKSNMLGTVDGVVDGVRARLVDFYNSQHVLCKELSLAPMRGKVLRQGNPQTLHMQFHQLLRPDEQQMPSLNLNCGDTFGLLPWKAAELLLPKSDFAMGLDNSPGMTAEPTSPTVAAETTAGAAGPSPEDERLNSIALRSSLLKWGRNGKPNMRYVLFDDTLNAIVWKKSESDTGPTGVLPLFKIQDICTGLETPVLKNVRNPKLKADLVFSIVSTDRTLDLQAESVESLEQWVTGLKAKYKKFVQTHSVDGEPPASAKDLDKKAKPYPQKYKSQKCALKNTCRKLTAMSAMGKTGGASANVK